ncbi:hypothetical protein Tco_0940050 [Tanacetum coccineum]|uniref:Uncharacterized protein n=1 Tax=Tanacetum coccineum TaxID=301880 RepID=A0ABQ5DLW1_9ASTR
MNWVFLYSLLRSRAQLAPGSLRGIFIETMLYRVLYKPLRPADMLLYSWDEGMDVCVDLTDIGYGFLLFSLSSFRELKKDEVTLLNRIWKLFVTQDIRARAAIHIFNRNCFTIARGPCQHLLSVGISAGLDVCVDLTRFSSLMQIRMVDSVPGRAVIDAAQRKRVMYKAKCSSGTLGKVEMSLIYSVAKVDDPDDFSARIPQLVSEQGGSRSRVYKFLGGLGWCHLLLLDIGLDVPTASFSTFLLIGFMVPTGLLTVISASIVRYWTTDALGSSTMMIGLVVSF